MNPRILLTTVILCLIFITSAGNGLASIDHQLSISLQGDNSNPAMDYLTETIALTSPLVEFTSVYKLWQSDPDIHDNTNLRLTTTALVVNYTATVILKYIILRDRPARKYQPRLWNTRITPSFPSGHTASSFLFVTWIATYHPKLLIPAATFTLASSFSQVYVGNHYVGDIIGGAILGILIGGIIFDRNKKDNDRYIESSPMFLTVTLSLPPNQKR